MRDLFESSGRVEVQSDAPERLSRVVEAIREQLEKDGALVSQTSEDELVFKGEPLFRQMFVLRRFGQRFLGLANGNIRFQSVGDRIAIEYRLAHRRWPAVVLSLVFGAILCMALFGASQCFIILPVMLLGSWLGSSAWARRFGWYCQKTAMRGLVEGAAEELHLLQMKTAPAHAR